MRVCDSDLGLAPKWLKETAPLDGTPRRSNTGYRKLDIEDRILLFLMRIRRRVPFEALALQFGVAVGTAHNVYMELLRLFHRSIVPRLILPLTPDRAAAWTPAKFKEDLPGAVFVVDLTSFRLKSKENVSLSRSLWSAYHHQSEIGVVFGETARITGCLFPCSQPSLDSCAVIAPNGLFVYRSDLFGGMTSEVSTIFNKSNLLERLQGERIRSTDSSSIFSSPRSQWRGSFLPTVLLTGSRLVLRTLRTTGRRSSGRGTSTCPRGSPRTVTSWRYVDSAKPIRNSPIDRRRERRCGTRTRCSRTGARSSACSRR